MPSYTLAALAFFGLASADTSIDALAHAAAVRGAATRSAPPPAPLRIAPNDPALFFSPFNWQVAAAAASTINAGAYFKCIFQGGWANLTFDVSQMVSPPSQIYVQIDNGPQTPFLVAPTVSLAAPSNLTHGDVPWHTLQVLVKSTTETRNRWSPAVPSTRVVFTGLTASAVAPWLPAPRSVLIYGDSITEGVLTLGGSQHFDTDHNDASVVYSHALGPLLGAEMGIVGFGATGLSRGGSGGVPALGVSWNQLWDGVPRAFAPQPDLVVFNEGTNDCGAPPAPCGIAPAMAAVIANLLGACPNATLAVMQPCEEEGPFFSRARAHAKFARRASALTPPSPITPHQHHAHAQNS
jgi:hypothetical protein